MKVIIAGSRDFDDYQTLKQRCDKILQFVDDITVVSGTCRGTDQLGEKYANNNGYKLVKFPADWNQFGKKAGFLRNKQMAEYSDALIAFWDGKSRGTKSMIELAEKNGLKIRTIII